MSGPMRLAIGIVTMGRGAILADTLRDIGNQTRRADRVLVCATVPGDVIDLPDWVELMFAPPGTSAQRNRLMEAAADCDIMLFLDDDFVAEPEYLAVTEAAFLGDPTLVVSTGALLADGAKGPGITVPEARRLIAAAPDVTDAYPQPAYNGYGCNMAVRLAAVRGTGEVFDEGMVFYAWYEDLDFTRRLGRHGAIRRLPGARGVHLGTKQGRGPGIRLGYAQVINPVYVARKGVYHWDRALRSIGRHIAMNLLRSFWPEPWIDRWGRLRGNLHGLADLLRGYVDPGRAGRLSQ